MVLCTLSHHNTLT